MKNLCDHIFLLKLEFSSLEAKYITDGHWHTSL